MEGKRDPTASARATQKGKSKQIKDKGVVEAESQQLETTIADLPSAITSNILLQLPIKSVVICKSVCRTWNALISDPLFAKLHFKHAQVHLLIRTSDPKTPIIGKTFGPICAGFGFQPKTNKYKVIRMWELCVRSQTNAHKWISEGVTVEMHTLGTRTWRNVGVNPRFFMSRLQFPTCVNGALHWINLDSFWWPLILCFNFESEKLQHFPPPPHILLGNNRIQNRERIGMGESEGFLYILNASFSNSVEMWVMKEYGIGESWTKVFTFSIDTFGGPLRWPYGLCWSEKHFKKGSAILMQRSSSIRFVYYKPEKHEFKFFKVHGTESILLEAIPHVPSLISLKDAAKGDNIEVLNVH